MKKSAVIFRQNANFLYRKLTNRTADFLVFGHFDPKTKDEKWNEQDIRNGIYLLTTKLSSFNAILSPLFDAFSFSAFSVVVFLCFIVLHFLTLVSYADVKALERLLGWI